MKKFRFYTIISLLVTLCIGQTAVATDVPAEEGDWNNDNSIFVEIKSKYVDEVLEDVAGAFADLLDLKATYITNKYIGDDFDHYLSLRLVLNNGGQTELDSAIAKLNADKRVERARVYDDAPFETVNTMSLNSSSYTIKVGDTITVNPEGELIIYNPLGFEFEAIKVELVDYDPEKEYTPYDFPHFEFASVEKWDDSNARCFYLVLTDPEYFNIFNATNALALDPSIKYVEPTYSAVAVEDVERYSEWRISDTSIADFVEFDEDDEITIKGLKPGKITLTYIRAFHDYIAWDYPITCEITVTEADIVPETTTVADITPETTQANDAPPTGDTYPIASIMLIMLSAISVVLVLTGAKRKAF